MSFEYQIQHVADQEAAAGMLLATAPLAVWHPIDGKQLRRGKPDMEPLETARDDGWVATVPYARGRRHKTKAR
ncbi:MAG: hypothetical protein QM775_16645 [Pirellulales bacterium]